MKSTLISLVILLSLSAIAGAQNHPLDKKSLILGGTASYQRAGGELYNVNNHKEVIVEVRPGFGVFASKGILVGVDFVFIKHTVDDYNLTIFGFAPKLAYYLDLNPQRGKIKGSLYPYAMTSVGLQTVDLSNNMGSQISLGLKFGADYMFSNTIALDFGIHYSHEMFIPNAAKITVNGDILIIEAGIIGFIY